MPTGGRLKKKITPSSAQQYVNQIATHAELSFGQSLYPGSNYNGLANYLISDQDSNSTSKTSWQTTNTYRAEFVCTHDLALEEGAPGRIQYFNDPDAFAGYCDQKREDASTCLLVFLSGKASPAWLSTIGWKCDVDPEFWLRHLNPHLQPNDSQFFTQPSLPSSSRNIVRLKVPTIGYRQHNEAYSQKALDGLRKATGQEMLSYNLAFQQARTGTSIVRSFAMHDLHHFSVEQEISFSINDFGSGWVAVIWVDSGKDLSTGPPGPWTSERLRSRSWKTTMTPTIMHRPDIALVTSYLKRRGDIPTTSKTQQCSSLLPQHYGRFLHQASSMKDPLYALGELFTFVATAQSQFFNMIEQQIDTETAHLLQTSLGAQEQEELNSAAISNFLYNKSIIEKHIYALRANVRTLEPGGCQDWPNNTEPKNKYRTSLSQDTILYDFVYLLSRAEKLSAACDRGINIAGNNAMVMESKRAGRQAAYMSRLTLLAFFYIPASFSTSAFGMNLTQLGQGDNPFLIYIWLGVLLACYIVTYFVWVLDLPALLKKWTTWLSNHVHSHSIS